MKKVLITGSNGLLGQTVTSLFLSNSNYLVIPTSNKDQSIPFKTELLDITDRSKVKSMLISEKPDFVINCAAFTHVDKCESEKEKCWKVNVSGPTYLAEACRALDSHLSHISTDYVFDGEEGPYKESDRVNPISYYGKSKLASENAVISTGIPHAIYRTMVVFGTGVNVKQNFAKWLVSQLKENQPVTIVTDQTGNVTLVDDLAKAVYKGVEKKAKGLYHAAGKNILSRYDFAKQLASVFGYDEGLIHPTLTASLNQPAPRPLKSGLLTLKAETELNIQFSSSEESLHQFKQQLRQSGLI